MSESVLVRTKLKPEEWAEFKALAAYASVPVSDLAADAIREKAVALRALLEGGKP